MAPTRPTAAALVPTPISGDGPWIGFAALPLALSLGTLALPARDTDPGDDWPDTETLLLPAGLLEPIRRARLDPDDAPVTFAVPALLAEAAGEVASLAGVR